MRGGCEESGLTWYDAVGSYETPKKLSRVTVDDECVGLGLLGKDTDDEDILCDTGAESVGVTGESLLGLPA